MFIRACLSNQKVRSVQHAEARESKAGYDAVGIWWGFCAAKILDAKAKVSGE